MFEFSCVCSAEKSYGFPIHWLPSLLKMTLMISMKLPCIWPKPPAGYGIVTASVQRCDASAENVKGKDIIAIISTFSDSIERL